MRGIQNRDRCFCISILSKEFVDFDFPKPIPLTTVMRDYLEEKVDEKYYIKNEKANKLIKQLIDSGVLPTEQNRTEQNRTEQNRLSQRLTSLSITHEVSNLQTVSRQDITLEYQTIKQTDAVLLSEKGTHFEKFINVATCLMARDYKGLGKQRGNGVIEKWQ